MEISALIGHIDYVNSVAFSPDGTRIVSGSFDCSVRVWDVNLACTLQKLDYSTEKIDAVVVTNENTLDLTRPLHQLNWTVNDDGWIVGLPSKNRIMWLPDTLTAYLYRPPNTLIISEQTSTLDLAGAEFGSNWGLCYEPEWF
ncbi:hypothetical protein DL96DRAFT_1586335 [Flagelloscypha sp. PMI_526]|nr:hypothetical protein DL96DRAFT_1586335 [Flagelloscypha sp. PMI_526]